jgi:hypothetical protein
VLEVRPVATRDQVWRRGGWWRAFEAKLRHDPSALSDGPKAAGFAAPEGPVLASVVVCFARSRTAVGLLRAAGRRGLTVTLTTVARDASGRRVRITRSAKLKRARH